jgi:hypothetical protein
LLADPGADISSAGQRVGSTETCGQMMMPFNCSYRNKNVLIVLTDKNMKGDGTLRGFEHVGKAIFCGTSEA